MAKIKLTAEQALKELGKLAEEFKKFKSESQKASNGATDSLKKLESKIKTVTEITRRFDKQIDSVNRRMLAMKTTTISIEIFLNALDAFSLKI